MAANFFSPICQNNYHITILNFNRPHLVIYTGFTVTSVQQIIWSALATTIGLYMHISARQRSNSLPYKLMHARASVMWKPENAHIFLAISGLLVSSYSIVWGLGYLEILGELYIDVIVKPFSRVVFTLLGAFSIHSITGFSLGIPPLRILRESTIEGEETRKRIIQYLTGNPTHFSALCSNLRMGKGQLRRHLDILIESGMVIETEVKNRKEYSISDEKK